MLFIDSAEINRLDEVLDQVELKAAVRTLESARPWLLPGTWQSTQAVPLP